MNANGLAMVSLWNFTQETFRENQAMV